MMLNRIFVHINTTFLFDLAVQSGPREAQESGKKKDGLKLSRCRRSFVMKMTTSIYGCIKTNLRAKSGL